MGRYTVIGLGRFGFHLASRLYELGHEVLGVDIDPELVKSAQSHLSQAAVVDVREKLQLLSLGLKDMDTIVISVGEHLEASTLAALYCKDLGVRVVARAVNEDHGRILEALGVHEIVYPERDMALRTAERISHNNLLDFVSLGPDFSILELAPPPSFVGKTLVQLNVRQRHNVHVIALRDVVREFLTVAPGPDEVIKETDVLVVLGRTNDLEKFQRVK